MNEEKASLITKTDLKEEYRAAMIADGAVEPVDDAEYLAAWQYLIDTGMAWTLQGRVGRTAMDLIAAGYCYPLATV